MKINFKDIKTTTLDGVVITNLYKSVADLIYRKARNLDLVQVALKINAGEEMDLSDVEINEIKQLISDPNEGLFAFARKAVLDYINNLGKEKQEK